MKPINRWISSFMMGMLLLGLAALVSAQDDHGDNPDDDHAEYTQEEVAAGYQLFIGSGCIACHGMNAEGSDTAPALAGHEPMRIRRQLRMPMGIMPLFTPDKISSEELELIVAFITSLGGEHAHQQSRVATEANWIYHWIAFSALEAGDIEEATHYIEHISDLVVGEHLTRMQQILAQIRVGEIALATQTLGAMLVDVARPTEEMEVFDPAMLHLQLAFAAADAGAVDETIHNIQHYIELTPDEDHTHLESVLAQFDDALNAAHQELEGLLGVMDMGEDHSG